MRKDKGQIINEIMVQFTSLAENVALSRVLTSSVVTHWDITISQLEDLKVAVSEAVSNAIIHGYENQKDGMVSMRFLCYETYLLIEIKDEGIGIENIQQAMEANFSSDKQRMGLGFSFMKMFTDELEVTSEVGKGTTVLLGKKMPVVKGKE